MKTLAFFFALFLSSNAFAQSANVLTVQADFAAFGRGDIQTIINSTTDNVVWKHAGNPSVIPFAGTFNGHDGVGRFFQNVGASVQMPVFEPMNFVEKGNTVTSAVHIKGIVLATGKEYENTAEMVFTFNAEGKITNWEAKGDVSGLEMAFAK